MYTTFITAKELQNIIHQTNIVVVDCRFSLADKEAGRKAYLEEHLPKAIYAHLDNDLSGKIISGQTGRHPLPDPSFFAEQLGDWGINNSTQVIVYDDNGGAIAARMWWMLNWLGHEKVAVLSSGIQAWKKAGFSLTNEIPPIKKTSFTFKVQEYLTVSVNELMALLENKNYKIIDSRAAERYRGENEPIDPIAGHIPSAESLPFMEHWDTEKQIQAKDQVKERFEKLLKEINPENTIFYCGSGVTACYNLLAYQHAGLGKAKLYPGSWSEWIIDEDRPKITQN